MAMAVLGAGSLTGARAQEAAPREAAPPGSFAGRGIEAGSLPAALATGIADAADSFRPGPTPASEVGLLNRWIEARVPEIWGDYRAYGWVEAGYTGSSTGPGLLRVQPRLNRFGDEFLLNQIGLAIGKPLRQDVFDLGFSMFYVAGADAALEQSRGGLDDRPGNPRFSHDFQELALDVHLPILTEGGMDVKVGRMIAIIGYSCFLAPYRPLYSADYQFYYAQDTAFTGFLTNLHVNDRIDIWNGMTLGANTFFTTRGADSFCYVGQVNAWVTEERRTRLTGSLYAGPDALLPAPGLGGDFMTMVELRLQQNWDERWTQVVQSNMGWETGTPVGTGTFYGLNTIVIHHMVPSLDTILRADWFTDPEGTRTGFDTDYAALTLGANWHPFPSLEVRPEIRLDVAGEPVFGPAGSPGGHRTQLTGGLGILWKF
jgi:hypothetical protein